MAVAKKSIPHYHKITTEVYETIKGTLLVYKNGQKYTVNKGEKITIEPGIIHHVEGDEVWFYTTSHPGWMMEDHIFIKKSNKR